VEAALIPVVVGLAALAGVVMVVTLQTQPLVQLILAAGVALVDCLLAAELLGRLGDLVLFIYGTLLLSPLHFLGALQSQQVPLVA
jgi:hypothetical protein